jgi:hypothetical protein
MKSKFNILYLDINNKPAEQLTIHADSDVKRMGEGLKTAYSLSKDKCYEIYYFAESSMNKK